MSPIEDQIDQSNVGEHVNSVRKIAMPFLVTAGALGSLVLAPISSAQADIHHRASQAVEVRANKCTNRHYSKVAYNFNRGPSKIPLRCGKGTWGYNHIVARGRWSSSFKTKISDTLWKGYTTSPGVVYRYKPGTGCSPNPRKNFKVVYNTGPLGGRPGGLTPQGIITASVEYTPRSAHAAC